MSVRLKLKLEWTCWTNLLFQAGRPSFACTDRSSFQNQKTLDTCPSRQPNSVGIGHQRSNTKQYQITEMEAPEVVNLNHSPPALGAGTTKVHCHTRVCFSGSHESYGRIVVCSRDVYRCQPIHVCSIPQLLSPVVSCKNVNILLCESHALATLPVSCCCRSAFTCHEELADCRAAWWCHTIAVGQACRASRHV